MPVFLLFAGIIHAIGLALLLPMLITLPGPEGESAPAPEIPSVDVIVLPPPQPLTDVGPEETSALPSASLGDDGNATGEAVPVAAEPEPGQEPRDGAVAPDAKDQAEAAPRRPSLPRPSLPRPSLPRESPHRRSRLRRQRRRGMARRRYLSRSLPSPTLRRRWSLGPRRCRSRQSIPRRSCALGFHPSRCRCA